MKTISIQQPWAWAIINKGKDIENRDWYTNIRGKVLIHAGKKIDKESYYFLHHQMGLFIPEDKELQTGGIIGSVEIVDCVRSSTSKWFFGKFGFVLRNPIELPFMPYRGQLGFFDVSYKDAREEGEGTGSTSSNTQRAEQKEGS
jgi:hypothetical protein